MRVVRPQQPTNGEHRAKRLRREEQTPPPHDVALERHFLGSCFRYPEIVLDSNLASTDFFSSANEIVFDAMLHLVADGTPVDTIEVRNYLEERGRLETIGGHDYLLALTNTIPIAVHNYARLRKLARLRQIREAALRVASSVQLEAHEFDRAVAALEACKIDLEAVSAPGARAPSLVDVIPMIATVGPRLPTGIAALDDACRGGVPMGRLVSVVGAPGASKTNLATWIGDRWERAGCAVLIVAADESRESIVVRLGQLDGFDRDALEGLDDGRRGAFAFRSRGRFLKVVDPFVDRINLEQCEAELVELACGRPRVLIVDSIQRVPSSSAANFETKREQLECVVEILDAIRKRGSIVIAISEMARAGYRTGKRELDISALAAAAETRAVEYASHLMIGLKPVRGERGIIDLEVAKNRLGPDKPDLRLALDFASLGFREIEKPADETVDRERQKSSGLRERLLKAAALEPCKTISAVIRVAGVRKRDGNAMARELLEEGALQKFGGVYRPVSTEDANQ